MLRILLLLFSMMLGSSIYAQQTVGLFFNDSTAYNGYTLISPTSSRSDYLIDNCGNLINSWTSEYVHGESAYLLENGNLLRTARIPSAFPGGGTGGRIEMYNWEGDLVWGYNYSTSEYHHHHDMEMLPNGNILLIAWEAHSTSEAIEAGRNPSLTGNNGVWATQIVEVESVGSDQANIAWEWHLWDHLIQDYDSTKTNYGVIADHPQLVDFNFAATIGGMSGGADWIHANAVDYNPDLDQIIVNSRVFNEFWIIDHSTTTQEAASGEGGNSGKGGDILYRWGNPQSYDRGSPADQKLYGQHDAQWIAQGYPDEGKIMVYNNGQGRPTGNYSSVDIINPPVDSEGNYELLPDLAYGPPQLFWTYDGQPSDEFFSSNISGANRLPNGNTIICEGREGHLFEIDPDGNIVWDYINPITPNGPVSQGNPINNNSVFRAYRYGVDYPAFEGKDLTPGAPLESNPFPSDCQIYDGTVSTTQVQGLENISVLENPIRDILTIENDLGKQIYIQVVDLMGRVLFFEKTDGHTILVETNRWAKGLYILRISDPEFKQFYIQKLIKQ
jgi:hypothetical protein